MRGLFEDFRKFINRGNMIDLAVAVVVGAAFKSVVDSFVANIIMPIIGALGGKPDFGKLLFTINESQFHYGRFLTDVISFLIIAAAVFVVVKVFETMQRMRRTRDVEEVPDELSDEAVLLSEIRDLLRAQSR